jgi:hypothetical protein
VPSLHFRPMLRPALGLVALALAALALAVATNPAGAAGHGNTGPSGQHHSEQRLVVRGDATVTDAPCPAGICLQLTDARFRGTPVGTGAYTGSVELKVADAYSNGEGGVCAPIRGQIVLGAGSPDRLILALAGDSCQDGAGNPTTTSFTGLARFAVKHGTGRYAGATGYGLASFSEDAADHDRMTLIGRISL